MSIPNLDSFRAQFKGDLVTPTDPDYDKAIARWATNAQRQAALVIFPKDAQDVSEAVKWVSANNLPLAVCGGGHSTFGASSVEGGVVIALSRYFGEVTVDPERKLAYVGGGALWKTVDKASMAHNLATVAGTVNHTGVGGLILGGGFGFLTSEHGLAIDNLVEATVVTADGSILKANDAENTDLFWGIRGGGGNFGITTEFILRLHPQRPTVFSGFAIFPADMAERIFTAGHHWFNNSDTTGATALLTLTNPPPEKQPLVIAVLFFNGSEEAGRQHFKWLYDLGPIMDQCKEIPYEEVNGLLAAAAPHGRGVCMTGAAQTTPDVALNIYKSFMKSIEQNPDFTVIVAFEFFGLDKVRQILPSATAFPARLAPSNIMIQCVFDGKAPNLKELEKRARALIAEFKRVAHDNSKAPAYGNYDGQGSELHTYDAAEAMFKENYPRLQKLKARYDPNSLFSRWFGIQPRG